MFEKLGWLEPAGTSLHRQLSGCQGSCWTQLLFRFKLHKLSIMLKVGVMGTPAYLLFS